MSNKKFKTLNNLMKRIIEDSSTDNVYLVGLTLIKKIDTNQETKDFYLSELNRLAK